MKVRLGCIFIFLCLLMMFSASHVLAQECKIVKTYPNGNYLVEIDGKTFITITEDQERKILKLKRDLLDAQSEIVLKDSLLSAYERTKAWYDTTLSRQKEYIAELEKVLKGYKELVQDYKKLKGEPWLTFEGGIGATGDKKPAVVMGLGIRCLRVYGFLQESNGGVLLGVSYPIF